MMITILLQGIREVPTEPELEGPKRNVTETNQHSIPISLLKHLKTLKHSLEELKRWEEGSYLEIQESFHHSHKVEHEFKAAKTVRT